MRRVPAARRARPCVPKRMRAGSSCPQRARKAREQASDLVDKGREVAKQQKEQFKSAYEAGRQAYHEATAADGGASKNL